MNVEWWRVKGWGMEALRWMLKGGCPSQVGTQAVILTAVRKPRCAGSGVGGSEVREKRRSHLHRRRLEMDRDPQDQLRQDSGLHREPPTTEKTSSGELVFDNGFVKT